MQLILQRDKPISIMQTRAKKKKKKNPLNQNGHSDNPQFCLEEKKSLIIFCNDYDAFAAISHDFFLAIASSPMTT